MTRQKEPGGYVKDEADRERKILIVSGDLGEAEFAAMGSKSATATEEIWIVIGDHSAATTGDVARLLALLELDRHRKVVYPGFLPRRPAGVFLFADGTIVHGRGRSLPRWALKEVDRLSAELVNKHEQYMAKVMEAIRGNPAEVLAPLPEDFILRDDEGLMGIAPPLPDLSPDLSSAPTDLNHDQVVQLNYARDRYMGHLTDAELGSRITDIFANLHVIDDQDRVAVKNADPEFSFWRILFAEVIKEMQVRFGPYPAGWKKGDGILDGVEWPGSLTYHKGKSAPQIGSLKPTSPLVEPVLVKYGERRYMEPVVEDGKLRISAASSYDDESLDPARRDDELNIGIDVGSFGVGRLGGLPHSLVHKSGIRRKVVFEIPTNYYVSCYSQLLSRRLLYDFHADCCVLISDPEEFLSRLKKAMNVRLPGWRVVANDVVYYDPLQVTEIEVRPLEWKRFRYAYQREFRVAWVPPSHRAQLDPIDVEIGPLSDIAEIVEMSS